MTSRTKKKNPFWKKPLKKLADLVSPPQPKRLLSGLPAEESLVSKEPPFLDFYDSLPNPTLKDTAGDIEKITNAVGDAGDKLIKLNGYYEEAKDKLGGGEKFEMIGAVFGHLQGIVDTVPFAGPIFACFKTFVDLEKAAKESLGAIGDLHGRVIFVLDTMRLLDKRYKWSKSDDFKHALKPLEVPIRMCSVLFLDYKEQSWFSRRLYGKDTVDKIKALDADLTTAMSDVRFAVGLTVAATMPAVSTVLDPSAQAQAAEQAVAVALSGGMTEFLKDPAKVTALGEELAKQLGERFDPGTMLAEVQRGFDERFNALDKSFKDVLDAVASQGKSIDEAKVMLDELSKRNSMYTQIRCVALRELWLTAGWGALVKMPDFIDVIVDKIRIDVTQVIARDKQLAKEDDTIAADLQVLYVGFADVLKAIDKDQSGKVSPKEANAFFAFHSWRLLDYFTLVSFFMTTTRAELLKSLQCELDLIARRLISPNKKNEYALFFSRLRLTITAMRDLAGEQSEFEGVLPYWLKKIPKLYDRNDMYAKIGTWDWKCMAKYAPPSFANLHALFAQSVTIAATLEGGIDAFKWDTFEVAVRRLETHISEWAPELAESLIKTIDAALVWHGNGSLLGDTQHAEHFGFTANRPFPRVAVMKHTTYRPLNAIVGGKIGDVTLYLASTMFRNKRGESYSYATYAREVDGGISCASCAPDNVSDFSWLVTPAAHDAKSSVSNPSEGILEWMSQSLQDAPHPLAGVVNVERSASPIFIARYKRDDDTILPGYLYIEDGVLHFVCAHTTEDKGRLIIGTQGAKGLWFPDDTKGVTFELLDRDTCTIELLIAHSEQFPFNASVSWTHAAKLCQKSRTTVIICESVAGPVHLAWCLGKSGVYLGTQVENSEVASYFEPGPDGKNIPAKTTRFLVLTGLQGKRSRPNEGTPHLMLKWRQQDRTNLNGGLIVQLATSNGRVVVARSHDKDDVGLEFLPPNNTATSAFVLAYHPKKEVNTGYRITLDTASAQGNIGALKWWLDAGLPFQYSAKAMDEASAAGHVEVLQWWKDLGKALRFTPAAIDLAAANGQIGSLKWWHGLYGKDMLCSVAAINGAAFNNKVEVLKWWAEQGLHFKFTHEALDIASERGYTGVLEWWAQAKLKFKISSKGLNGVTEQGHLVVLTFWRKHLSDAKFRKKASTCMDYARNTDTLNWFRDEGVWGYTSDAIDWAVNARNVKMEQWWYDAGVPLKYTIIRGPRGWDFKDATPPMPTPEQLAKVAPPTVADAHGDDGSDSKSVSSVNSDQDLIDQACENGDVDVHKAWLESGDHVQYSEDALDSAARNGHVEIIKTWFEASLPIRCTEKAIDDASTNGHLEVLDLWKSSGHELFYSDKAMNGAYANGHVRVLYWWILSGLELRYSGIGMDEASRNGRVNMLQWWLDSGLELKYSDNAIDRASMYGHVNVLQWWLDSGLELKYTDRAMNDASKYGHIDVLQWWRYSGLELKYSNGAMNWASEDGHIDVFEWWLDSGLELKYSEFAIDGASAKGHIDVLQWWRDSGLELKYSELAMNWASKNGHIDVLQWWHDSGLELKYSEGAMDRASENGHIDVLQWWRDSGLELKYSEGAMDWEVIAASI